MSTHAAPHLVELPTHLHVDALQNPAVPHCVPHAPQLEGSVVVLTHAPAHNVVGAVHEVWHMPTLHRSPEAQTVPHVPQLVGSFWVSTHAEPQRLTGGNDGVQRHVPPTQISGAVQAVPHPPQLFGSLLVVVHRALAPAPQTI